MKWSGQTFNPLKNLLPLFPIPVPARTADRRDLESGRHFNSFRTENRVARSGVISLSFTLLQEITVSLSSFFRVSYRELHFYFIAS